MVSRTTDATPGRRGIVAMLLAAWFAALLPPDARAVSGIVPQTLQQIFPETKKTKTPAAKPTPNAPLTIEADTMGYDKNTQIVVAIGHVVVVQGDYVLQADKLTYYQQTDHVEAQGNVSVLQPSGDVFFADSAQLSDGVKTGVIRAFKERMSDNSLLAANSAHKVNEAVTVLHQAVYSPCTICENLAPFWQIKSSTMRVDEEAEEITYHNAQLEMFGVPTFYSPYLSGPTPNAEAQSVILAPIWSSGGSLGFNVKTPYYWRISEDKQMTITPRFFTNDNPLLETEYQQLTDNGHYDIRFSGIDSQKFNSLGVAVPGEELRGSLEATGVESLTDDSRVGFDINHASDKTYLQRYSIGGGEDGVLFSNVYAEADQQRNYAEIQAIGIQGLRVTDDVRTTPQVVPALDGYYETAPLDNGLRFHVSGDAQSLTRDEGADQRRISMTTGATYPYITDNGQVFNATANLRQDLYDVDDVTLTTGGTYTGTDARTIPQGALQWRYPFVRASNGGAITVEPIVLGVVQPNGDNPQKIENEDSQLLELSDTNIFDIDRVPGYDVVDSGARVAYGLRSEYLMHGGEAIDGLLGQSYSFNSDTPFPNSTKPGADASDIIGRVGFLVSPIVLTYRFALGESDLNFNRSSFNAEFTKPWVDWGVTYNLVKNNQYLPNSEEISSKVTLPVYDQWKIYASGIRDLQLDRTTNVGGGLIFHNECFDLTLDALRNYTQELEVVPSTTITFRVAFKNLGVFGD